MNDSTRPRFQGLIAEAHTPLSPDGRLDAAVVARQYELFQESGVDGAFLCGTAGEGLSLTVAERRALLDTWVGVTAGHFPLIAHVGHDSVRDAVTLAAHANNAGATAVAAMAPGYYRPMTLEDLIEFLAPIAAAAPDVPFLYYDAPDFNGVRFPTDQILEWGRLRIPTLAGVTYASADLALFTRCLALPGEVDMLIGYEELLLPALACGAHGAVGVELNFAAPAYRRVLEAFATGDIRVARLAQAEALTLTRALGEFGVIRASKAIMSLLGVDCGSVRPPLRPLSGVEMRALHERIRGMELFARPLGTPAELGL